MSWAIAWNLLVVFLTRHCLIAFLNAGATTLLGLSLLRGVERFRWPRLSPLTLLRLRRLVILVALTKGAFYMLRGTAARNLGSDPCAFGFQFPDPYQWIGLAPMSTINIWKPTTATAWVTAVLVSGGMLLLGWRLKQLVSSQYRLQALRQITDDSSMPRVEALLRQAAGVMSWPRSVPLPQIVLAELPYFTPLLLGLRRPMLLLSPELTNSLSDLELEMALRHELAHCLRRDQWWRWLQTWLEDVGRFSGLARLLGTRALALEEEICDRMAIRTSAEARALGRAIYKATQTAPGNSGWASPLPENVIPALLGWRTRSWNEPVLLSTRLSTLATIAEEMSVEEAAEDVAANPAQEPYPLRKAMQRSMSRVVQIFGNAWLGLMLALILYAKFNVVIGHSW